MEASDGGEVYSPGVRREVFFEKRVLWPWQAVAVDGLRRWRSVLAERRRKAFFKISSLALASRRRIILRREEVFFSAASRKEPKESPQRGLTYGSPPLDSPTPVGWLKGAESASMRLASGAARSESLYRAFADVRPVPGFTRSGVQLKSVFCWQSSLLMAGGKIELSGLGER